MSPAANWLVVQMDDIRPHGRQCHAEILACVFSARQIGSKQIMIFLFCLAGDGNPKESSPFINSSELDTGKNMALFEVRRDRGRYCRH